MDKKSIFSNLILVLLVTHIVASYFVPFDFNKPVISLILTAMVLYFKHLENTQLPDIRKEVESSLAKYEKYLVEIENKYEHKIAELEKGQQDLYKNLKNDVSKYEALLTKAHPTGKVVRF